MTTEGKGNIYQAKLIESSSPLTKQPSTPFRIGVLGLLERDDCPVLIETPNEPKVAMGSDRPIIPQVPGSVCQVTAPSSVVEIEVGQSKFVNVDHGENLLFLDSITTTSDVVGINLSSEGQLTLKGLKAYVGEVTFNASYNNCLNCAFTLNVNIFEKVEPEPPVDPPQPPPPPPDPEDPTEVPSNCGEEIINSSGFTLNNFGVMPDGIYTIEIQVYGIPDKIYIYSGDPRNGGTLIASKHITEPNRKTYHFTLTGGDKGLYIQFNEFGTAENSSYIYKLHCDPVTTPLPESTDLGNDLPNPHEGGGQAPESGDTPSTPGSRDVVYDSSPSGKLELNEDTLKVMKEGDLALILCNGSTEPGCKYNVYIDDQLLVSNVDIESGTRHKLVLLTVEDKPHLVNGKGKVTIEAVSAVKNVWSIFVCSYEHAYTYVKDYTNIKTPAVGDVVEHYASIDKLSNGKISIDETGSNKIDFIID